MCVYCFIFVQKLTEQWNVMSEFSDKLIDWYALNKRELPWRETKDPYRIWISEIILQQTRVVQGYDYYIRFVRRFPDVFALAEADEDEALVFEVVRNADGSDGFNVVLDDEIIDAVFAEYNRLLDESQA